MKLLKRGAAILLTFVFIAGSFFAQPLTAKGDGDYYLNQHNIFMTMNYTSSLYFIGPDGRTSEGTWTVSDPTVVEYRKQWEDVKPLKPGYATIHYESPDGVYSDDCNVTVVRGIGKNGITLYKDGDVDTVQLSYIGEDGTVVEGSWTSSNTSVATVDENGLVTAVGVGNSLIEFYSNETDEWDYCHIEVKQAYSLSVHEALLHVNGGVNLDFYGGDGQPIKGTLTSSNPEVADSDGDNYIRAKSVGNATITYKSRDGKYTDTCEITVYQGLNVHNLDLMLDSAVDSIRLFFTDPDGNELAGSFYSDDESIATVSDSGFVSPVSVGTTYINYEYDDYENGIYYYDYCEVTVKKAYSLNRESLILSTVDSKEILFYGADGEELKYGTDFTVESSDRNIAYYEPWEENNGGIYGRNPGNATITFKTRDGKHTAKCEVTVVKGLNIHELEFVLDNEQDPVQLIFYGLDDAVLSGDYYSNNESVVTVDSNGWLTPQGTGETEVYFNAWDPESSTSYWDYCRVTVKKGYTLSRHEIVHAPRYSESIYFYGPDGEPLSDNAFSAVSDNPDVAYYSDGNIYTVSKGTATITFTAGTNSDSCQVMVYQGFDRKELVFTLGQDEDPVQLRFYGPGDEELHGDYYSGDDSIVTIDKNGWVTPVGVGETSVSVDYWDGENSYYDWCEVKVVKAYTLDRHDKVITVDNGFSLTFYGADGQELDPDYYTVTSSNPDVATFSYGWVYGRKVGHTTLTFSITEDGVTHTDRCEVDELRQSDAGIWQRYRSYPVRFLR